MAANQYGPPDDFSTGDNIHTRPEFFVERSSLRKAVVNVEDRDNARAGTKANKKKPLTTNLGGGSLCLSYVGYFPFGGDIL